MKSRAVLSNIAAISFLAVFLLAHGLMPAHALATDYYVSQSLGADGNDGKSPDKAWKTLARASQGKYVPGDKILLRRGDAWQNDELHPKGSGTSEKPIVIASYGTGSRPILDGMDDLKDRFGIHLKDDEGYKIAGIEFTRYMTGIYAEYSDGAPNRKFLWIEDCYFHDSQLYQHYEDYPKHKVGLGVCLFSHECHNKVVLSDITIKNCEFRRLASAIWTNSPDNFNWTADNIWNFANMVIEDCTFEECKQWPLGLRGIDGGAVRRCLTLDIGRNNVAFNGVAGAMIQRCKHFIFEDSEWGCVSLGPIGGKASIDGEAFDFEANCIDHVMRRCLFHDTDGPCFMFCYGSSGPGPQIDILLENCVFNGKSARSGESAHPKVEITSLSSKNLATFKDCRIYLSKGEGVTQTPAGLTFTNCLIKPLSKACGTDNLAKAAKASASSSVPGHDPANAIDGKNATAWKAAAPTDQWIELDFGRPTTLNEFRIKEDASSSTARYVIECWDDKAAKWIGCFNGLTIGPDFMAPIVSRTTTKARLLVKRTLSGNPAIAEFQAYNDMRWSSE